MPESDRRRLRSGRGGEGVERLRLTPRSVILAVGMLGATLSFLALVAASKRVIGWLLAAATAAGLLHPVVSRLARHMRRGLAVLVTMVAVIGSTGAVIYGLVDDIQQETRRLQAVAPERARQLERSERFGELARDLKLVERTRRFVDEVPERLRGGTPAEALRAAGTRGVAFLATTVLTVFLLLHGSRMVGAAAGQVSDPARRDRVKTVAIAVYRRAFGYAGANLTMALAAGLFAYAAGRVANVPGAAALGIWVGLWDLVPLAGAFVGALPIIGLAAAVSAERAIGLAVAFLVYQLIEDLAVARPVQAATVRVGPFLTLAAGLVGLELSGVAGALLCVLAATMAVAAADELGTEADPAANTTR
jgi:predicted PurR-regulated permease PerM